VTSGQYEEAFKFSLTQARDQELARMSQLMITRRLCKEWGVCVAAKA